MATNNDSGVRRVSISQTFSALRAKGRIGLMPFIPAGYPDLDATAAILPALEQAGASLIEVGVPFSDPIADGPVIQEAFTYSLAKKIRVADVFATVAKVRGRMSIPLVAMLSYSLVFRYGVEKFCAEAKASGFDGLIIPDLPPPEAQGVCGKIRSAGLETILLVAPSTTAARRTEIARLSSGFVYYLSVAGITGERDRLPADLEANVKALREVSQVPVCVGFGIHRPEHVKQLQGHADGAIVGTALVRRLKEHLDESPAKLALAAGDYCRELLSQVV